MARLRVSYPDPGRASAHTSFTEYINGMKEVEAAKVPSRAEADKILEKVEPVSPSFPSQCLWLEGIQPWFAYFGQLRLKSS